MNEQKVLGYMFSLCSRTYKKAINQKLEKYNLTTVQCGVLRILKHRGELTQVEIAEIYASDKATIGCVIQKLMEKGYLKKEQNHIDKRAFVVLLTPKALKVADEIEQISDEVEKRALKGLTTQEIDQFYRVLGQINRNLNL